MKFFQLCFILLCFIVVGNSKDLSKEEINDFVNNYNSYEYYNQAKNGDVNKAINICNTSAMFGYRVIDKKNNTNEEIIGEKLLPICKIASEAGDTNSKRKYAQILMEYDNIELKTKSFTLFKELANKNDDLSYSNLASMYTSKPFFDLYKAEKWYLKAINSKILTRSKAMNECSLASIYFLYPNSTFYNLDKATMYINNGLKHSSQQLFIDYCNNIKKFYMQSLQKSNNHNETNYNNSNSFGGF